jgi:hypothetical protein
MLILRPIAGDLCRKSGTGVGFSLELRLYLPIIIPPTASLTILPSDTEGVVNQPTQSKKLSRRERNSFAGGYNLAMTGHCPPLS